MAAGGEKLPTLSPLLVPFRSGRVNRVGANSELNLLSVANSVDLFSGCNLLCALRIETPQSDPRGLLGVHPAGCFCEAAKWRPKLKIILPAKRCRLDRMLNWRARLLSGQTLWTIKGKTMLLAGCSLKPSSTCFDHQLATRRSGTCCPRGAVRSG